MEFQATKHVTLMEDEHSISGSTSSLLSSSDLSDDACSNNSSRASSSGPLYDLADLMDQLLIKRGLSKFYHGKSQTFAELVDVKSVEDLGKKETSVGRRMKSCKSYGGNSNIRLRYGPKAKIAKRDTKTSCSSSLATKSSLFIHG